MLYFKAKVCVLEAHERLNQLQTPLWSIWQHSLFVDRGCIQMRYVAINRLIVP